MPARDEATTVCELVRRTRRVLGAPVLVVSDASTDATAAEARRGGAQVLELAVQLGAWGATQAGLRYARRKGYSAVATLDADGQHDPETLPALAAALLEQDADVVIGTFPPRLSRARKLAWTWFRSLTGLAIEDLTSGLRVYGPRAVRVLASPEATLLDYQDVGVLLLLRKHRLLVIERPAAMHARGVGRSRVFASWLLVAHYMLQTTILCVARIGRVRPAQPASLLRANP
ncbi:MAG TPA: glycosyltransferase family 2 protein [Xanthomonadaceae bacterium]|nr:glycosyltransferase family 2 protein [Xanthomonadaceae bacterium]